MFDLDARVVDWLHEISQWAITGIGKGILDVNMSVDDEKRVMAGHVVANNNDGVIHLKGYMAGPKDASISNYDPLMGDMWELIDFDIHVGIQRNKWQKTTGTEREVRLIANRRRRFGEGVMPLEFQQSINRKVIISEYGTDGAFYV